MKETLIRVAIFSVGVGVGIVASMTYFDKKYQKLADEEIESCRQAFSKPKVIFTEHDGWYTKETVTEPEKHVEIDPLGSNVYSSSVQLETKAYSDYYAPKKVEEAETLSPKEDEPFDISVDEYEEDTEFMKVTLNLYLTDGALVYEETEELADEGSTVGQENLDDFSRTSFSSAYFRNPKNNIDYEVIKVDGSYRELIAGDI
jgi:hypothetical protein